MARTGGERSLEKVPPVYEKVVVHAVQSAARVKPGDEIAEYEKDYGSHVTRP